MKLTIWYLLCSCLLVMVGCTINMIQTDTHGTAEDVVNSDPQTDVKADPVISLPLSPAS